MEKQMGINEFKELYLGLGGIVHWRGLFRYNDLRKNGRRLKFRVYNESNNKDLIINVINELNRIDGGGWEYMRLGGNREEGMNLKVFWDLYKFYEKVG
jgi:hypothetical protein